MATTDTAYSARFDLPEMFEQGRDNTCLCRVYRAGNLVAPTSGTCTVKNRAGAVVVAAEAVTITDGIATCPIASATLATQTRGEGWSIEWALLMPDDVVHTFRNEAALVRARLYSPITEANLYRVNSAIDPSQPGVIHSLPDFADKIDEALVQIENRLIGRGNRPNLILSPSALREAMIYLTLAMIFEDFSSRLNAAYAEAAKAYRIQFEAAWGRLSFSYDADGDDGIAESSTRRKGGISMLWLGGRG